MEAHLRHLVREDRGAVAPTVALALFGLIAVGGVAFDYARMVSMDTELQNAADQAALAAASQLTGDAGACGRAAAAASDMLANLTRMANDGDGDGMAVTIPSEPDCDAIGQIRFYQDEAKTTAATTDAEAQFVEVHVNPREAIYALTPVVGAFSSGQLAAIAFATLGEAYCKVPPVMICNPQETVTSQDFDPASLDGVGLRLVSVGSGSGGWAPGNFGYLDMAGLSNGAPGLREGLGWGIPPTNCIQETGLDTKPGATVTVTGAINTRFDLYNNSNDCPAGGTCPASINSVKDIVRSANAVTTGNGCKLHNQGWGLPTGYYGSQTGQSNTTALPATTIPSAMGHPRDMCHAGDPSLAGHCNGPIGDGNWDRDAYFRTNYIRADGTRWTSSDWQTNTGLGTSPRRYDVYLWEIENRGDVVDGVTVLGATPPGATGTTKIAKGEPICSPAQGYGSGTVPGDLSPDRRKITVAVVNCLDEGVNGNSTGVQTVGWLDAFLVEPSLNRARTNEGDVYVEVIGATTTGVQLVSKKVPYLVE